MALFRKKPTLNEQMLRDAGLDRVVFNTPQPAPTESGPTTGRPRLSPRVKSTPGPKTWDAVTTVLAPGIEGDSATFTVLPDGDLIVFSEDADNNFSGLADAIEANHSPPYSAQASRQEGDIWAVRAWGIEVAEFAYPDAETLQLSRREGVSEFRIDDGPTDVAPPPELVQLGENAGSEFFAVARRIDGDYWEVMVNRF